MENIISVTVRIGTADAFTVLVPSNTSIRQIFEDNGYDPYKGSTTLNGVAILDMEKTLADMNITESCRLYNVVKTDNA